MVGGGDGGRGRDDVDDDAVCYNHLYLVPKPATLEGRIKNRKALLIKYRRAKSINSE